MNDSEKIIADLEAKAARSKARLEQDRFALALMRSLFKEEGDG